MRYDMIMVAQGNGKRDNGKDLLDIMGWMEFRGLGWDGMQMGM